MPAGGDWTEAANSAISHLRQQTESWVDRELVTAMSFIR